MEYLESHEDRHRYAIFDKKDSKQPYIHYDLHHEPDKGGHWDAVGTGFEKEGKNYDDLMGSEDGSKPPHKDYHHLEELANIAEKHAKSKFNYDPENGQPGHPDFGHPQNIRSSVRFGTEKRSKDDEKYEQALQQQHDKKNKSALENIDSWEKQRKTDIKSGKYQSFQPSNYNSEKIR